MSWIIYGSIAILMIYMMFKGGCCGDGHASHESRNDSYGGYNSGGCCGGSMSHSNHEGHVENSMNRNVGMVQDPVCGMYVSRQDAISREINGKTYYFCSNNCADEFERKHTL